MRILFLLLAFLAGAGLVGPTAREAAAQCTHFGNQGACPVGIPNGSTSVTVNANGTITWNSGGVSGPCCAAPSGTETGAGLLNLNNEIGGAPFHFGPVVSGLGGTSDPGTDIVIISGRGFEDRLLGPPNCDLGGCTGNNLLGDVFGANPNSGYLCDGGSAGCGNDLWTTAPQTGFGSCGAGGCGDPAPITALDFSNIPGTGPYAANQTSGNIDPFGGGGSFFMDPATGQAISISDNPTEWPTHVQHADELNTAYINGEIPYPFNDPDWSNKSVDDFKNGQAENQGGARQSNPTGAPDFYAPVAGSSTSNPYASLTNYVNAALGSTQPGTRPADVSTAPADTSTNTNIIYPERRTNLTRSRDEIGSQIDRVEQNGQTTFHVNSRGSLARFDSSEDAFYFANRLRFDGKSFEETIRDLPDERRPIPDSPAVTNPVDAIREGVPKEFQGPTLTDRMDGEIHDIYITDPRTGERSNFNSRQQAEEAIDLMRSRGISAAEAKAEILARPTVTPDGLASANRGGVSTPSTAAPAGSAPTFTNNRPAIILPSNVTTTPDGLASANSGGVTTPSTPAPAGSAPTFTNNRPAVIVGDGAKAFSLEPRVNASGEAIEPFVRPDDARGWAVQDPAGRSVDFVSYNQAKEMVMALRRGATWDEAQKTGREAPVFQPRDVNAPMASPDGLASANSGGVSTPSTPAPAGSAPTFTNNRPAIIVQPTRPEGTSAGTMKGLLNGTPYDIEVIRTPDGKALAVGTGEYANHVFGEVKETSNKLFGDWRREGPWSPPPAKTTQSAPATAAPPARQTPAPPQTANAQVRSQIANSDRDHMIQPVFLDGFESGSTSAWSSTGR
jgi:hypothetical protein